MASWIWVSISSSDGLVPVSHQAIAWTNAELVSIRPLGTNSSKSLIKIQNFPLKKINTFGKLGDAKWRQFYFGPQCVKDVTCIAKVLEAI